MFAYGVYGGTLFCNDVGYPPDTDYGVTYDWNANELRFGDNIDGERYRCHGTPYPIVALLGALMTSGGITATAVD